MTGRAEVARLKQRLEATFSRVRALNADPELQSDFARYLCVLVSGYVEQSVVELTLAHVRRSSGPTLHRYVDQRTKRFANANSKKIQNLLGDFDVDWRLNLESFIVDDLKGALDSVVALRNKIAHGESVGITLVTITNYYERIQHIVDRIAEICDPL